MKLGSLYVSQERFGDALSILDAGITSSTEHKSQLFLQKGSVYLRAGSNQLALEEFNRCRLWNESHGDLAYSEPNQLHYFTGEALLRLGQLDQALPEFQRAIQLDPNLEWPWPTYAAYVGLGDVYLRQQDLTRAQAAYQQAYAIALPGDQRELVSARLDNLKATLPTPN